MATYDYTGWLTDLGESPFPDALPRLTVVAAADPFGPRGLVAGAMREVVVPVLADGRFSVTLTPSTDLSPSVPYRLKCTWFTTSVNGQQVPAGWAEWEFVAVSGGGRIKDMVDAPMSTWFVGPPVPETLPRGAFYFDAVTGDIFREE